MFGFNLHFLLPSSIVIPSQYQCYCCCDCYLLLFENSILILISPNFNSTLDCIMWMAFSHLSIVLFKTLNLEEILTINKRSIFESINSRQWLEWLIKSNWLLKQIASFCWLLLRKRRKKNQCNVMRMNRMKNSMYLDIFFILFHYFVVNLKTQKKWTKTKKESFRWFVLEFVYYYYYSSRIRFFLIVTRMIERILHNASIIANRYRLLNNLSSNSILSILSLCVSKF